MLSARGRAPNSHCFAFASIFHSEKNSLSQSVFGQNSEPRYSQPVTHVSTNPARRSLTSVIGRELVYSTRFDAKRKKTVPDTLMIFENLFQTKKIDFKLLVQFCQARRADSKYIYLTA